MKQSSWPTGMGRRWSRLAAVLLVASFVVLGPAGPAGATWSVVAVEPETGRVGAAIASCVPADVLGRTDGPLVPVVLVPGVGAAVTQGQLDVTAPGRIVALLETGADPAAVVADLTDPDNDSLASVRQHAVAALGPELTSAPAVAAHSGPELSASALDRQGPTVSVQGNLLVSDAVVVQSLDAFQTARDDGDELAGALVDALVAGSAAGGDRRCGEQTALFAQVVVAGPDDDPARPSILLTVLVAEGDGGNPVAELGQAWADGRRGLIDLAEPSTGGSGWFRIAVFAAAAAMIAGAGLAFARGMGSISARRTSPPS